MVSGKVKVANKRGIHLRLAGELVKTASKFKSRVMIGRNEDFINAKSILGVAGLGAEFGTELFLNAEGDDEKEALETMIDVIHNKFYMEE
ncbi:MAG: HPr family phosphocarrier protein [Candidatus Krumholzibacteriota bacterium]|nr:HPr family phosphocarrier protein [Candidatus Krumholzibacteriota bacterium]